MNKKLKKIRQLEKGLKRKASYKKAEGMVDKFLKSKKEKAEEIIINPYAEHPWQIGTDLFSNRWKG